MSRLSAGLLIVVVLASTVVVLCAEPAPPGSPLNPFDPPPGTAWLGNELGLSETPPPPFEPVRLQESQGSLTVTCWGRRYELGVLGLPRRIISAGEPILAQPIELRVVSDGEELLWQQTSCRVTERSPVKVQLKGAANSALGRLRWTCTAEYDGLLRYDFILHPAAGATVDNFEIVFPLKQECASFYYFAPGSRGATHQMLSGWWHQWWLGNEEQGLEAFCETEEAANSAGRRDCFRVEPGEQVTNVVWNFANETWEVRDPWRFTFGLLATPVKDSTAKWHRYRAGGPGRNVNIYWPQTSVQPFYTHPIPNDVDQFRTLVAAAHAEGEKFIPYSMLTQISGSTPAWQAHEAEWLRPDKWHIGADHPDTGRFGAVIYAARPTQSFIDYIVWQNYHLVKELGLDGIYVDYSMTQFWNKTRRGQRMRYWPFFRVRELFKRVYTMLKELNPDNLLIAHMSPHLEPHLIAFTDIYLDGEGNWVGQLGDNYLEVIPLEAMRAEFMGHQYGVIPWFLPQWYGATLEDQDVAKFQDNGKPAQVTIEKSHHLFGLGLLHDFGFWPICGTNPEASEQYYGVLDEFGIGDAKFYGYWDNAGLIDGQTEAIKASAYRKPDGGGLVCVYNVTREAQKPTLRVDWQRLQGQDPLTVVDAYTKEPVVTDGQNVALEVPPLNYRLLWVR